MGCRELDITSYYRFVSTQCTPKKSHLCVSASPCTPKNAYSGFPHTVVSGYRYYDADMGRWLNRDPIEEYGGLNLYAMLANDPINLWDFLGFTERKRHWAEIMYRREFQSLLEDSNFGKKGYVESRNINKMLHIGCLGLTCIKLGLQNARVLPEDLDSTQCYMTEPEADVRTCKKNYYNVVWAKQGAWKDGKKPKTDEKNKTIPNDSIVSISKKQDEKGRGVWNYVTEIKRNNDVFYAWMNYGNADLKPSQNQIIFMRTYPFNIEAADGYSAEM